EFFGKNGVCYELVVSGRLEFPDRDGAASYLFATVHVAIGEGSGSQSPGLARRLGRRVGGWRGENGERGEACTHHHQHRLPFCSPLHSAFAPGYRYASFSSGVTGSRNIQQRIPH